MTNQEVIRRMESIREYLCAGNPIWNVDEMREVFDMTISALEKQIPRELIAEGDGYADGSMVYDIFYCPSCDHRLEDDEVEDYCPNCGQKICWEEE